MCYLGGKQEKRYGGGCFASAAGRCGDHDGVWVDFGDAEVAAEVEQVEGADGAGDFDEVHGAGAAEQDGDVADFGAFEVEPEIGEGAVRLGILRGAGVGIDEVLPAGGVEVGDEGGEGFGV